MESPKVREAQAKQFLDDALLFERAGTHDLALERVQRVIDGYGEVPSANLARDARKRNEEGLPLFVTGTAVIATKAEPEAPAEPEPEPPAVAANVEIVSPSAPPAVVAVPEPMLPRVEPRRVTGVGLPRSNVAARPLPSGFRAREEAGVHESGWPLEITCDRDGGTMVLVLGSTFTQGRDDGRPEERPAHKITLPSYYIDQHEVTANQFKAFRDDYALSGDKPAVQISLADAREYAQWAGKSLPTEAQWEMAARTPDGRIYPWGNSKPEWGRPRTPKQIDPVMSFPGDLSPYGVFDLSGNAWEWTNDWFDTKYYGTLKGRVTANPAGPAQGKSRIPEVVIKGGSKEWDGSWRTGMRPEAKLPHLGFRCVLNIEGAPAAGAPGTRAEPSRPGSGTPF